MDATVSSSPRHAPTRAEPPPPPPPDRALHTMGGLLCAGVLFCAIGLSWWAVREPAAVPASVRPQTAAVCCAEPCNEEAPDDAAPRRTPAPAAEWNWSRPPARRPAAPPRPADAPEPLVERPTIVGFAAADVLPEEAPAWRTCGSEAAEAPLGKNAKLKGPPSWTEAELLRMLRRVPTVALNDAHKPKLVQAAALEAQRRPNAASPLAALEAMKKLQPALGQLGFEPVSGTQLTPERSQEMAYLSPRLRAAVKASTARVKTKNPWQPKEIIRAEALRRALLKGDWTGIELPAEAGVLNLKTTLKNWRQPAAAAILNQLLSGEATPVRLLLVELLAAIPGPEATARLAQRAVFDLAPEVRRAAVGVLQKRPREEARASLLAGLNHPWLPANYHAAHALEQLADLDALPALQALLDQPDPREPAPIRGGYAIREVVKADHTNNCLMCHAPSISGRDLVRVAMPRKAIASPGAMAAQGQQLGVDSPPALRSWGAKAVGDRMGWSAESALPSELLGSGRAFGPGFMNDLREQLKAQDHSSTPEVTLLPTDVLIRGDVVYLRQDFSVTWSSPVNYLVPNHDRFDFLVRERPISAEEYAERISTNQTGQKHIKRHEAVLHALDRLTALKGEGGDKRAKTAIAQACRGAADAEQETMRRFRPALPPTASAGQE